MKVIYLSSSTIPSRKANSIHVMKMCQAFSQLGCNVELCHPRRPQREELSTGNDLHAHYGIYEEFPIVGLTASPWCREYDYSIRAARYAVRNKADIVFSRNLAAATLAAWQGIPTIHEFHEPPHDSLSRLGHRLLAKGRGLYRLAAITDALRVELLRFYKGDVTEEQIVILPDAVDLERFEALSDVREARQSLGLPVERLTIGYAGHMYEGRGIDLLLELTQRLPLYHFLLVGGEDRDIEKYRCKSKQAGVDNITLTGFVPNEKLPTYLAACDILVMPYQQKVAASRGGDIAKWLSPMKMFEYMATGRLIISSDLPVLREILSDQSCVFCAPDKPDEWEVAITRAAHEPDWRLRLGARAKADVAQYTWKKRAERVLASLDNIRCSG